MLVIAQFMVLFVLPFILVAQYFWAEDDGIRKPLALGGLAWLAIAVILMAVRLAQLGSFGL